MSVNQFMDQFSDLFCISGICESQSRGKEHPISNQVRRIEAEKRRGQPAMPRISTSAPRIGSSSTVKYVSKSVYENLDTLDEPTIPGPKMLTKVADEPAAFCAHSGRPQHLTTTRAKSQSDFFSDYTIA